jgi:hypothetical protein
MSACVSTAVHKISERAFAHGKRNIHFNLQAQFLVFSRSDSYMIGEIYYVESLQESLMKVPISERETFVDQVIINELMKNSYGKNYYTYHFQNKILENLPEGSKITYFFTDANDHTVEISITIQ